MTPLKLLPVVLLLTTATFAQKTTLKKPLPPAAFSRMIVQDITYAIVGQNTPVSGIKVDVSKPEGTISGMFPINEKSKFPFDIVGFELKGGVTDNNFSLFKGGFATGNSTYEIKLPFHRITYLNSAKYGGYRLRAKKMILFAQNNLVVANKKSIEDSIYVITALYNHYFQILGDPKKTSIQRSTDSLNIRSIAANWIPKILKKPDLVIDPKKSWQEILSNLTPADTLTAADTAGLKDYNDELVTTYKKFEKLKGRKLYEQTLDKMIVNASTIWTKKKYFWYTITPFLRSDKANEYYTNLNGLDTMYFKSGYRFSYGGSIIFNKYCVMPNKLAILARLGASVSRTNNLSNLSPFNYENKTPFFEYGSSVTEKTVTGAAINHSDVVTGTEGLLRGELYILPLGALCPGLYLAGNIGKSNLYKLPKVLGRADDTFKAGAEGGLIFNINNREKDKTFLSIIAYFKYADLTDKQRTSLTTGKEETRDDFKNRNMSIGLKIGIPITLPQKS